MLFDKVALVGKKVLVTATIQIDSNMAAIAAVGATIASVQDMLLGRLGTVITDQIEIL